MTHCSMWACFCQSRLLHGATLVFLLYLSYMDFYAMPIPPHKRWFQKWWGKIMIIFGGLFCLLLLLVVGTTIYYWWQIHTGKQPAFIDEWHGQFTSSLPRTGPALSANRSALEGVNNPYLGRLSAPVVIVEFIDFRCPNCKASAPIIKQVAAKYGYGVKILLRDFPAESIHSGATELARMARCADRQNKYWKMHDVLFEHQAELSEALSDGDRKILADLAGVDYAQLNICLADPAVDDAIRKDYLDGIAYGVAGTPTFFINGQKVEGVVPFETWQRYLDQVVKK